MKKKTKPIDKINTKLLIFITCMVLITSAVVSCSVNLATGITYMKVLSQSSTTAPYLFNSAVTEETATSALSEDATASTYEEATSVIFTESTAKSTQTISTSRTEKSTLAPTSSAANVPKTTAVSTTEAVQETETIATTKEPYTTQKAAKTNDGKYYITASGTKYHVSSCTYLKKSMIEISLSEAIEKGYKPCSRCIE